MNNGIKETLIINEWFIVQKNRKLGNVLRHDGGFGLLQTKFPDYTDTMIQFMPPAYNSIIYEGPSNHTSFAIFA